MTAGFVSRLFDSPRIPLSAAEAGVPDADAYIESSALEYPTRLDDVFVERALSLGVSSGVALAIGTRVGLLSLKILWQNPNFYAIGVDSSGRLIERARETAAAWELHERAVFQVGDARRLRFKTGYFDLVICDQSLHRFDDPDAVLAEIRRVVKPRGGILIRDFKRPGRFGFRRRVTSCAARFGRAVREHYESAIRASMTRNEIEQLLHRTSIDGAAVFEFEDMHVGIERRGETDPGSWVIERNKYG